MYIKFNVENIALKKPKSLCFARKGKFLKGGGIKSNDENRMKSNDGIPSPHGRWEWRYVFFGWFFKQKYSE